MGLAFSLNPRAKSGRTVTCLPLALSFSFGAGEACAGGAAMEATLGISCPRRDTCRLIARVAGCQRLEFRDFSGLRFVVPRSAPLPNLLAAEPVVQKPLGPALLFSFLPLQFRIQHTFQLPPFRTTRQKRDLCLNDTVLCGVGHGPQLLPACRSVLRIGPFQCPAVCLFLHRIVLVDNRCKRLFPTPKDGHTVALPRAFNAGSKHNPALQLRAARVLKQTADLEQSAERNRHPTPARPARSGA